MLPTERFNCPLFSSLPTSLCGASMHSFSFLSIFNLPSSSYFVFIIISYFNSRCNCKSCQLYDISFTLALYLFLYVNLESSCIFHIPHLILPGDDYPSWNNWTRSSVSCFVCEYFSSQNFNLKKILNRKAYMPKAYSEPCQRRIQNLCKHLKWSILLK